MMSTSRIFIVHLRRPKANDPRWDPFYELGSFGCTGCHSHNLLNARNRRIGTNDQLAFIQGGLAGSRLVLLTPPVEVRHHPSGSDEGVVEVRWNPESKPFTYETAPLVATNSRAKDSQFPKLRGSIQRVKRRSAAAKLASRYRSSARPLTSQLASEMRSIAKKAARSPSVYRIAESYAETLAGNIAAKSKASRRRELARLRREANSGATTGCRNTQRSQCR